MTTAALEDPRPVGDNTSALDPTVDFVAGTVGGIVGLIVGFPLDTVKVRFQDPATTTIYHRLGTFSTIAKILHDERLPGLYKGIMSPMASYAFLNGLIFSSYGYLMKLQLGQESQEPTIAQITLAGAGSGIVASLITCPTDLVKIRQQALINSRPTASRVALDIFRKHGIQGLYRGMTITALRDLGYGAYFATYEGCCRLLRPSPSPYPHPSLYPDVGDELQQQLSWPRLMAAGGIAGVVGWAATFGFDVVKTRIQAKERSSTNPYDNILSTVRCSYRREGLRVFFIGLTPTLIRKVASHTNGLAVPVNMVTFGAFELVKSLAT
ncbi:mitochondrial carrier [Hysterangium stoloniferum]|nr:mitochondrial carrier [Hysterangium stoloniferum]